MAALPFVGDPQEAAFYWSDDQGGYAEVPVTVADGVALAQVSHFSSGFVAADPSFMITQSFWAVQVNDQSLNVPCPELDQDFTTPRSNGLFGTTSRSTGVVWGVDFPKDASILVAGTGPGDYRIVDSGTLTASPSDVFGLQMLVPTNGAAPYYSTVGAPVSSTSYNRITKVQLVSSTATTMTYRVWASFQAAMRSPSGTYPAQGSWSLLVTYPALPSASSPTSCAGCDAGGAGVDAAGADGADASRVGDAGVVTTFPLEADGGGPFEFDWLLVDSTYAYVMADDSPLQPVHSTLFRVPLAGGSPTPIWTAAGVEAAGHLALNSTSVLWLAGEAAADGSVSPQVLSLPKTATLGDSPKVVSSADSLDFDARLLADDQAVYWTAGNVVLRQTLGGGTPQTIYTDPIGGSSVIRAIAMAGSNMTARFDCPMTTGCPVDVFPVTGQNPNRLAMGLFPQTIAIDGSNVYYTANDPTNGDVQQVLKLPFSGGGPVTLGSLASMESVLEDANFVVASAGVYWVNDDGLLQRLPLGGGAPTTLWGMVDLYTTAGPLAVGGSDVYFFCNPAADESFGICEVPR
jgi:hypothetical protein